MSYLGGSGGDSGVAIAVDSTGAAVVTGTTMSTDFPVTPNALQPNYFGNTDVFITKVSPDGATLVYSTYAGGSQSDVPSSLALDPSGDAYITGLTFSSDYPVSAGRFKRICLPL